MAIRKVIKIDEEKCDGCGQCIPNCPEGAISIIDKKARLVADSFCDGLGACLGHCPRGAIAIEERQAAEYTGPAVNEAHAHSAGGVSVCPGAKIMGLQRQETGQERISHSRRGSCLMNWPVQIALVPPSAYYLDNADLLIAADCLAFAYADFHQELLKNKVLLVACPKLDDIKLHQDKITQILKYNDVKSITYAHMEVPCCSGLSKIIESAVAGSGKRIAFEEVIVSIKGERLK